MDICKILNLDCKKLNEYTKDEIKERYKKIAMECHPDKLDSNLPDWDREEKIDKFKQASIAYKVAIDDIDKYGKIIRSGFNDNIFNQVPAYDFNNFKYDFEIYKNFDAGFWDDTIDMIKSKDFLKNTFLDVAEFFVKNQFYPKKYYDPNRVKVIKHNIILPISYYDLYKKSKKKLRLILKGVKDPVFFNINCRKDYPSVMKQYLDDDSCEHEISIKMKLDNMNDDNCHEYSHIVREEGIIDLIKNIEISWYEYLLGCNKKIKYIDGSDINIKMDAFKMDKQIIKGKGIFCGDLIIYFNLINIKEKEWKKLDETHKKSVINILKMI